MDAHMWLVKAWTYPDPPKVSLDVTKVEIKSINTRECETKNWSKLYNKKIIFLSATWLRHNQMLAYVEGIVSLTWC